MTEQFDYYIFIDYSESLIGYDILERDKLNGLLPKLSRFRHYKNSKKRKLYIKKISETIQRENIKDYFFKIKIKNKNNSLEIYSDVLEFLKKHDSCLVFISVDDNQFRNFQKLVKIVNVKGTKIIKESELKQGSVEYKISLVLDNLLNIERRNKK
ncbi:MAG: hypothetical protein AABY06_00375 [Nanoarchaeota archaeon]